jgi:hypothetical protein
MSADFQSKLEKLRSDYHHLSGTSFSHFFCPILFNDEDVPLCESHIVNLAFPNSSRNWTVQRKDVDNFYGSRFEADFLAIQYNENPHLGRTITSRKLSQMFRPKILADDIPIEFFVAKDKVPGHFTRVVFDSDGEQVQLGLKMSTQDMLAATVKNWQIAIEKDVRIAALVSLIKAAHLTLFETLGYRYALSGGGHFVGRQILGEFFLRNHPKPKRDVVRNAYPFFREFVHMVRPVESSGIDFCGTVVDGRLLVCKENHAPPWAFIVFLKISRSSHAVMIPILDQPYSASKFVKFLHDKNDSIEVVLGRFEQDHWTIEKNSTEIRWPKTGVLYP